MVTSNSDARGVLNTSLQGAEQIHRQVYLANSTREEFTSRISQNLGEIAQTPGASHEIKRDTLVFREAAVSGLLAGELPISTADVSNGFKAASSQVLPKTVHGAFSGANAGAVIPPETQTTIGGTEPTRGKANLTGAKPQRLNS